MDTLGSADPSVEVFTVSDQVASTTVKKNTRKPTWNERLWTMVQVRFCVLIGVFRLG
jgi:Ca2+-dependent lipid-binding protein